MIYKEFCHVVIHTETKGESRKVKSGRVDVQALLSFSYLTAIVIAAGLGMSFGNESDKQKELICLICVGLWLNNYKLWTGSRL